MWFHQEENFVRVRVPTEKIVLVVGFNERKIVIVVGFQLEKNCDSGRVSTKEELCKRCGSIN